MDKKELQRNYNYLFSTDREKAAAFDKIAEQFYFCNFGAMQKSDLETLMFSLYLDRILDHSESDINSYSDYTLSKYLGMTQNKISSLKVRKELKYPYPGFDWKKSFERISKNARYENGKIKINIPDKNLYLELKNAIESVGGYVDVQLNSTLLQVTPECFIELLASISDNENDREVIRKELVKMLKKHSKNQANLEFLEQASIADVLNGSRGAIAVSVVGEVFSSCIGKLSPTLGKIASNIFQVIQNSI